MICNRLVLFYFFFISIQFLKHTQEINLGHDLLKFNCSRKEEKRWTYPTMDFFSISKGLCRASHPFFLGKLITEEWYTNAL